MRSIFNGRDVVNVVAFLQNEKKQLYMFLNDLNFYQQNLMLRKKTIVYHLLDIEIIHDKNQLITSIYYQSTLSEKFSHFDVFVFRS